MALRDSFRYRISSLIQWWIQGEFKKLKKVRRFLKNKKEKCPMRLPLLHLGSTFIKRAIH